MLKRLAATIVSLCVVVVMAGHAYAFDPPASGDGARASPEVAAGAEPPSMTVSILATEAACCTGSENAEEARTGHPCTVDTACFLGTRLLFAGYITAPARPACLDSSREGLAVSTPEKPPRPFS